MNDEQLNRALQIRAELTSLREFERRYSRLVKSSYQRKIYFHLEGREKEHSNYMAYSSTPAALREDEDTIFEIHREFMLTKCRNRIAELEKEFDNL